MNDFNFIAPYYDRIAKLVFGSAIGRAQLAYLNRIPKGSKVLILGGGTGWIAQEVIMQIEGVSITYLEKSEKMIEMTKSQLSDAEMTNVKFVCQSFEELEHEGQYDAVLCNFFLDLFSAPQLIEVIKKIKENLRQNGILLVSDFQVNSTFRTIIWQKPMLWIMHAFFRIVSRLQSKGLQPIEETIQTEGFQLTDRALFSMKFIFSAVFCK